VSDVSRRNFLRLLPTGAISALALRPSMLRSPRIVHPEPRPGIDGSEVMTAEQLAAFPAETVAIYDMVREIPHIADGIGCSCGCSALPNYRSLLTCFHATGMAMGCAICQGQARLAYRRSQEGQSLEQIRRATDARFG
jgi:hypothetical protein